MFQRYLNEWLFCTIYTHYPAGNLILMSIISVFIQVLKIGLIGHRKRILASLGDRLHEDTPQKPPRAISLRVSESQWADKCVVWTMKTPQQYLNQRRFKLLWIHQMGEESTGSFPDGCVFLWGSYSLPTAAVTTQLINQISQAGTKWSTHCSFLPAGLSWILISRNWLSLSHWCYALMSLQ